MSQTSSSVKGLKKSFSGVELRTDGEVIRGQACDALEGLRDPCDFNPLRWVFVMPADQAFAVQRIMSHALKARGMDSLEAKV